MLLAAVYYRVLPLDTVLNNQPFRLLAPTAGPANGFSLNLTGVSGQPSLIQTSTNLVDWVTVAALTNLTGTLRFEDPTATKYGCRFYRLVTP